MNQTLLSTPHVSVSCDYGSNDIVVVTALERTKNNFKVQYSGHIVGFIYWLYNSRCIMCKRSATEINEITPRSRSKDAILDFRNRVPLCSECHRDFHRDGVTDEKQKIMRMRREIFLIALGRKDYI